MTPITGAVRRDDTIVRIPYQGDNFHATWGADDRQYLALCDGGGQAPFSTFYNSRLVALDGGPTDAVVSDVAGYPLLEGFGKYYGFGTLAIGDTIHQYLATPRGFFAAADDLFVGSKLISTPDGGRTWTNQDGSTPVRWETERDRGSMVFFEEEDAAFAVIALLQMGRGYAANRDGYVYGYSPNGATEGTMNQLVLFRVPTASLADRSAYEFFAGGESWSADIRDRVPVHTFPSGWVNRLYHPWCWLPSVAYVEPLGLYLMANWATPPTAAGSWFGGPSYLSLSTAPTPWGPWTVIHEDTAWAPEGDARTRCYSPVILPKWIADDGMSFWLQWTDFGEYGDADALPEDWQSLLTTDPAAFARHKQSSQPYYALNFQRVDLLAD